MEPEDNHVMKFMGVNRFLFISLCY